MFYETDKHPVGNRYTCQPTEQQDNVQRQGQNQNQGRKPCLPATKEIIDS